MPLKVLGQTTSLLTGLRCTIEFFVKMSVQAIATKKEETVI